MSTPDLEKAAQPYGAGAPGGPRQGRARRARDRGALADQIPTDPVIGAGVAYVRLAIDPDPVRVRAAWVTDADIRAMVAEYAPAGKVRPLRADAA
jgi:hypothetical protein